MPVGDVGNAGRKGCRGVTRNEVGGGGIEWMRRVWFAEVGGVVVAVVFSFSIHVSGL